MIKRTLLQYATMLALLLAILASCSKSTTPHKSKTFDKQEIRLMIEESRGMGYSGSPLP